jgi:hypothetical protein
MSKTVDKQRSNSGDRDEKGRFKKGNGKSFQPGQSGNPAGRPKSITLSEALRHELAKINPTAEEEGQTFAETIAAMMVKTAAAQGQGSILAAKEIADRTEGKSRVTVSMDVTTTDWREMACAHGINEQDVIREAKRIISESDTTGRNPTSH